MNILVLNGSPKKKTSNTLKLTQAFLKGFQSVKSASVDLVEVSDLDLHPCRGCFSCWNKTPGTCIIKDDMAEIIEKLLWADLVILSFPLYYFGIPSELKMLMDRLLPMALPFMVNDEESGGHPSRYETKETRYVMISTCGFYTAEGNYASVNAQFDRAYGRGNYETIYCGQGELFRVPQLSGRTDAYLAYVEKAGQEYAKGTILAETRKHLSELLFPREVFEEMADASWGVERKGTEGNPAKAEPALSFTRQMAALYNPDSWKDHDRVLEFYYTDVDQTYQIVLEQSGHKVLTENFLPPTTRIETPLKVWQQIGSGELDGIRAMMDHLYRVTGDFELMFHWDRYFGLSGANPLKQASAPRKKTNMALMLLPWIVAWVSLAIDPHFGGILCIALCALLPFAFLKWKMTVFECVTVSLVSILSLLSLLGVSTLYLLPLSYFGFGLMWSVTVFCKLPLSACYSMNQYGEEEALKNPLFIRTNRILTALWGLLYLVTPFWTYYLLLSPAGSLSGAVNSVLPALLGIFTAWFQKWYPAHYAGK